MSTRFYSFLKKLPYIFFNVRLFFNIKIIIYNSNIFQNNYYLFRVKIMLRIKSKYNYILYYMLFLFFSLAYCVYKH